MGGIVEAMASATTAEHKILLVKWNIGYSLVHNHNQFNLDCCWRVYWHCGDRVIHDHESNYKIHKKKTLTNFNQIFVMSSWFFSSCKIENRRLELEENKKKILKFNLIETVLQFFVPLCLKFNLALNVCAFV